MSDSSDSDSDSDSERISRKLSSINRFASTRFNPNENMSNLSPREEKLRKLEEFERTAFGRCLTGTAYLLQLICLPITCPCLTCYMYFFNEDLNDDEDTHNAGSFNVSKFVFRRKSENENTHSHVRNLLSGIRFKKAVKNVVKKEFKPTRLTMMSASKLTVAAANEGLIPNAQETRKTASGGGGFLKALKLAQAKGSTQITEETEDDSADEIGAPISNVTKSKSTGTINGNGKNMLLKALNANASIAPETTTTVTETKNTEEHNNKSSGNSSGNSSSSSSSNSSSNSSNSKRTGVSFSDPSSTLGSAKLPKSNSKVAKSLDPNNINSEVATLVKADIMKGTEIGNVEMRGSHITPTKTENAINTPISIHHSYRSADSESKGFSPLSSPSYSNSHSLTMIASASSPGFQAPKPSPTYVKSMSQKYPRNIKGPAIADL